MAGPPVFQVNGAKKSPGLGNLGIDDQGVAEDLDRLLLAAVPAAEAQVGCHAPAVEHKGVGIASEQLGERGLGSRRPIPERLGKGRQRRLDRDRGRAVLAPDASGFRCFGCALRSLDPDCDRDLPVGSPREFATHGPARGDRRVAEQGIGAHEFERRLVAKTLGHQGRQSRL